MESSNAFDPPFADPNFSSDTAKAFLSSRYKEKSHRERLACWLISFGVFRPERETFDEFLRSSAGEYSKLSADFLGDCKSDPLSLLSRPTAKVIHDDISRSVGWFYQLCDQLSIPRNSVADPIGSAYRVLTLISLRNPKNTYVQGHDRFYFISTVVALQYCLDASLPSVFSESLSLLLTEKWLSISLIASLLSDPESTVAHYSYLSDQIEKHFPSVSANLKLYDHSAMDFAFKWELLFFADEHHASDILIIFDNILLHSDCVEGYVRSLVLAHIKQLKDRNTDPDFLRIACEGTEWDIDTILSDADSFMVGNPYIVPIIVGAAVVALVACASFFAFRHFKKRNN